MRANVNMQRDAKVYPVLTAYVFVTYDPQIRHGEQIGNRKRAFWKTSGTLGETYYYIL